MVRLQNKGFLYCSFGVVVGDSWINKWLYFNVLFLFCFFAGTQAAHDIIVKV